MFIRHAGKPTKIKKIIYLIAATVLGFLLNIIAHSLIEINYIKWALSHGQLVRFYGDCALWPALQIGILLAGIIGGFFLGKAWWRIIYIERRWGETLTRADL